MVAHQPKEFTGEPSSVTSLFTQEFHLYSYKLGTYYWFPGGLTAEANRRFCSAEAVIVSDIRLPGWFKSASLPTHEWSKVFIDEISPDCELHVTYYNAPCMKVNLAENLQLSFLRGQMRLDSLSAEHPPRHGPFGQPYQKVHSSLLSSAVLSQYL